LGCIRAGSGRGRSAQHARLTTETRQQRRLILSPEQLYFPSIKFGLDGILGFPVITQLQEPLVHPSIGGKEVTLTDLGVRTTPAFKGQRHYGNIGQDVIRQFDEMILDFASMSVEFKYQLDVGPTQLKELDAALRSGGASDTDMGDVILRIVYQLILLTAHIPARNGLPSSKSSAMQCRSCVGTCRDKAGA
jgi:hypothetical protein